MPSAAARAFKSSPLRHSRAPDLFDALLDRLLTLPAASVYVVVGALAAVENVFPPIPADTAVAIGAFLSHHGTVSAPAVFAVTWVSNVLSAAVVYVAGRTLGRQFFTGRLGQRLLDPRRLAKIERLYHEHGTWGIFLSRFVPAARAVLPPFAGVAGVSAPRALLPLAAASAIWYGTLTVLVAATAGRIEEAIRLVSRLHWVLLGATVVVAALLVMAWQSRRRRSRPDTVDDG